MKVLVTGGAGFVGFNLTRRLLTEGHTVSVLDDMSRQGSDFRRKVLDGIPECNLNWVTDDVRNLSSVKRAIEGANVVFHLAAQVAVTTSVVDPTTDFEINARGTLNVLEAARQMEIKPLVVFASTNKVYGEQEDLTCVEQETRFDCPGIPNGISEDAPLDFHSPYGCSKGAADQYVRDYYRIYDIPTVVFRLSCIYGPWQLGNEEQGWASHFVISALLGRNLSIYGNGKQVRDILFVDDLVNAFLSVIENLDWCKGQVYNLGGGPTRSIAVWAEFGPMLEKMLGKELKVSFGSWRPGDQRFYVTDSSKAAKHFGWRPETSVEQGVEALVGWAKDNLDDIRSFWASG